MTTTTTTVRIGKTLAIWRKEAGLTQKELAKKLGYNTPQYVSNWERGNTLPAAKKIKKLATALHCKPVDIADFLVEAYEEKLQELI